MDDGVPDEERSHHSLLDGPAGKVERDRRHLHQPTHGRVEDLLRVFKDHLEPEFGALDDTGDDMPAEELCEFGEPFGPWGELGQGFAH